MTGAHHHTCGLLLVCLVALCLLSGCGAGGLVGGDGGSLAARPTTRASNVELDLSAHDFTRTPLVYLSGEWLYFPGRLVGPHSLPPETGRLVRVPHRWARNDGGVAGVATYVLDLRLPAAQEPFALIMPTVSSAVRLYVDGTELVTAGVVSADADEARPGYHPGIYRLPAGRASLRLVAHVSNYEHARAGLWRVPRVGPLSAARRQATVKIALTVMLTSAVGLVGLFRLLLWFLSDRDPTALSVVPISLLIVLRALVIDDVYLLELMDGLSWEQLTRLDYLSLAGLGGLGWVYLAQLFPREVPRPWLLAGTLPCLLYALFVLIAPVASFTAMLPLLQLWGLCTALALPALLLPSIPRDGVDRLAYLVGVTLLSVILVHDIAISVFSTLPVISLADAPSGLLTLSAALILVPQSITLAVRTARTSQELQHRTRELMEARDRLDRYAKELETRVAGRTAELEAANQRLERLARVDDLTGLGNRRQFDEQLVALWADHRRRHAALGLLMIDVDQFKHYNDTHGHQRGDSTLRAVAEALRRVVNRPLDEVARYGGEEIAVLLPNTGLEDACTVAERMRSAVEALQIPHKGSAHAVVTVSIGVAAVVPGDAIPHALVETADAALYDAKLSGRNRVVAASSSGSPQQQQQQQR